MRIGIILCCKNFNVVILSKAKDLGSLRIRRFFAVLRMTKKGQNDLCNRGVKNRSAIISKLPSEQGFYNPGKTALLVFHPLQAAVFTGLDDHVVQGRLIQFLHL